QASAAMLPIAFLSVLGMDGSTVEVALGLAASAILGGGWAVLVLFVTARIRRERPVWMAVADLFTAVGDLAAAVVAGQTRFEAARAAVVDAVDATLTLTTPPTVARRSTRHQLRWLSWEINRCVHVTRGLIDMHYLAHDRFGGRDEGGVWEQAVVGSMSAVGGWCRGQAKAAAAEVPGGGPEPPQAAIDVAAAPLDSGDAEDQALASALRALPPAMALDASLTDLPDIWPEYRPVELLRANLRPQSLLFRDASRFAVAVAVGALVAGGIELVHGWWIALTVVIVLKSGIGDTLDRVALRIVGTVAGAVVAGVLTSVLLGRSVVLAACATVFLVLMVSLNRISYFYWVAFMTPFLLLTLGLNGGLTGWDLALWRTVDTLIGSAIALAAALLLWPNRSDQRLSALVRADAAAVGAYLDAATCESPPTSEGLLAQHRQVMLADSDARTALEVYRNEPTTHRINVDDLRRTLDGCRMVRDRIQILGNAVSDRGLELSPADRTALTAARRVLAGLAEPGGWHGPETSAVGAGIDNAEQLTSPEVRAVCSAIGLMVESRVGTRPIG
ncbi:MAG: FUSC family protein, partial [Actinomycetes bacterium]